MSEEQFGMQCWIATEVGPPPVPCQAIIFQDMNIGTFKTHLRVFIIRCTLQNDAKVTAPVIDICETDVPAGATLRGRVYVRGLVPHDVEALAARYPLCIVGAVITRELYTAVQGNKRITVHKGDVPDDEVREYGPQYLLHGEL